MSKGLVIVAIAAVLAFAGSPALAGRHQITADDVAQFKVGVTTYNDVVAKLGKPMSVSVTSNGMRIIAYVGIKSRVKAASFIPIVGMFAGGATADTSVATFTFGPDGLLQSSSATNSDVDCSTSIISMGCAEGSAGAPPTPAPAPAPASTAPAPATTPPVTQPASSTPPQTAPH